MDWAGESYDAHTALAVGSVDAGVSPTRISKYVRRSGTVFLQRENHMRQQMVLAHTARCLRSAHLFQSCTNDTVTRPCMSTCLRMPAVLGGRKKKQKQDKATAQLSRAHHHGACSSSVCVHEP